MEEIAQLITNIISNVGFPIACVLLMFWQAEKERVRHTEESKRWADVIDKNSAAIDRNTDIIERLITKE